MVNKITTPPTTSELIGKVNEIVDDKQDTLISGTNIKTINNQSLLGSGNITISGGVDSVNGKTGTVVLTTSDLTNDSGYITSSALTPYALASSLASVALSGDYDDLINTPDLSFKSDIDLSNVTNVGTSKVAGWAMPSDTYVDLTLGADGASYTAPANGYFCFYRIQNGKVGYTKLTNSTTGFISETRNTIDKAGNGAWIMARKNDVVTLNYDGATTLRQWRFYYAQGSESEAN